MIPSIQEIKSLNAYVFDIECYRNFFLVVFKKLDKSDTRIFSFHDKQKAIDLLLTLKKLRSFFNENSKIIFGYNSRNYDNYVLNKFMSCGNLLDTKAYSDSLIKQSYGRRNPFPKCLQDILRDTFVLNDNIELYDVDLMMLLGLKHSLKICECIFKMNSIEELPIKPDAYIEQHQILPMTSYCEHDCDATIETFYNNKKKPNSTWEEIDMRLQLCSLIPDTDDKPFKNIMSYAEPTLVSSIIPAMAKKHLNIDQKTSLRNKAPEQKMTLTVKDVLDPIFFTPNFFTSPQANEMINIIAEKVILRPKTEIELLKDEEGEKSINIGTSFRHVLKFGSLKLMIACGGIHSKNDPQIIKEGIILDLDVRSYYPSIILNYGIGPEGWREAYLTVYSFLKQLRVEAKLKNNKVFDKGLKLVLNAAFGKLKSVASVIHNQKGRFQITMNGQLWLVKLVDMIYNILPSTNFLQANTDGITLVLKTEDEKNTIQKICEEWSKLANFDLEDNIYKEIYMRDVNNYIAIKANLDTKAKGTYAEKTAKSGGNKYPRVCVEAAMKYVMFGHSYTQYIDETLEKAKTDDYYIHDFLIYGKTKTDLYMGDQIQDIHVYRCYISNNGKRLQFTTKKNVKVTIGESLNLILNVEKERENFFKTIDIHAYYEQAKTFVHELIGINDEIPKICYEAIESNKSISEYIEYEYSVATGSRLYDFVTDKKQKVTKLQLKKCIEIATKLNIKDENEEEEDE